MSSDWTCHLEAHFTDSRPVLDLKYEIETRIKRILTRDPERSDALVFRDHSRSYTTRDGESTIELRLAAAYDTYSLYTFQIDAREGGEPPQGNQWDENLHAAFARWTTGLVLTEDRPPSFPDRYRQVVEETLAHEIELANYVNKDDEEAIRVVQDAIINGLRQGKSLFTANKEGGTHIRFIGGGFVFQDYGESDDREEFSSSEEFLARLRKFYDWESRRDWYPHPAPELVVWRYIDKELQGPLKS